jgi:hypothetical protein
MDWFTTLRDTFFDKKENHYKGLENYSALKQVPSLMQKLNKKKIQLITDAQSKGFASLDFRKAVIFTKLEDELNEKIDEFNQKAQQTVVSQEEIIGLVKALTTIVVNYKKLFSNTLMSPRNHYRETANISTKISNYALSIGAASALSLGTLSTLLSLMIVTPKVDRLVRKKVGLSNENTASMQLVNDLIHGLRNLGNNLILEKNWFNKLEMIEIKVSDSFYCPINLTIMQDPVILTLDGRTYERQAICKWLNEKGNSPFDRNTKLRLEQTLEDVLVPNRALKEMIEELKEHCPQFFDDVEDRARMKL